MTRCRKVTDHEGKEFSLFLPPKPVKGKKWDDALLYWGQLHQGGEVYENRSAVGVSLPLQRSDEQQERQV